MNHCISGAAVMSIPGNMALAMENMFLIPFLEEVISELRIAGLVSPVLLNVLVTTQFRIVVDDNVRANCKLPA